VLVKMAEESEVEISYEGEIGAVVFKGTSISDAVKITAVSRQVSQFVDENHPKKIVVDFEQVKFFSSQVLGVLLGMRARLKDYGGEVVISGIEPQLHRVFKITNLDKIFRFFPDKQTAVDMLSEQK